MSVAALSDECLTRRAYEVGPLCSKKPRASTIVPARMSGPLSARWALISSKRARVRLLSCSRWRNLSSVVASGTDSRDRSTPTKSRSAWLSYSASSSASSARPYHCCRQYMRSMVGTPIGWRPTRPLVGYSGSMTAISRAHGTMRSISPRNFSRRVRFFFIAYSALAKLRCDMLVLSLAMVLRCMHAPCRTGRIDQHFLRLYSEQAVAPLVGALVSRVEQLGGTLDGQVK